MEQKNEKIRISGLDIRIVISVAICVLTTTILNAFQLNFTYDGKRMEIIQTLTSCIGCLLCCQDNAKISWKSGTNRLVITAIGGAVGMLVTVVNNWMPAPWLLVVMIVLGLLLTLLLCKMAKVPYINARIGGLTFVLVVCTLSGSARIYYAAFRFVSTFYAVLVVMFVTMVWQYLFQRR